MHFQSTNLLQIGDNTYMYTGTKKEKAENEGGGEGGASTTEDEDDDMLGDEAVLISRASEDVEEAQDAYGGDEFDDESLSEAGTPSGKFVRGRSYAEGRKKHNTG